MQSYELTERGKIVIAVVLVVLFFVIPAAILAYNARASQPAAPPVEQGSDPSGVPPAHISIPPPIISESPPPNGGGFNPPDISPPNGTGGQEPARPPDFGPTGGNPSEGTLSFLFSPNLQNTLDPETLSLLAVLLGSANNTEDNQIAVEMPQLSGEYADKLISAIINAFAAHGVSEQRIAFIAHPAGEVEGAIEISLSFIMSRPK